MEEVKEFNKSTWFLNQWFDSLLLAAFPTVFIIILLVYFLYAHLPTLDAYNYLYTALNFPHTLAGLSVVYLYQREWKERPLQFAWIPLVFISILLIFLFLNNYKTLASFRYVCGGLHMLIQDYYIIGLYKLRNNDNLKIDKTMDTSFLVGVHSDYLLRSLPYVIQARIGHSTHNIEIFKNIMKYFLKNCWNPFIQFIVIAFILRQVYLFFRYKKTFPFKILMFTAIFISYYYLLAINRNVYIAHTGLTQLHNIQWIFWVWFYHRQKLKQEMPEEAKFFSYNLQLHHVGLHLFYLLLISIVFNFFLTFRIKTPLNRISLVHDPLALFHFFIEIFIWKASRMRRIVGELAKKTI